MYQRAFSSSRAPVTARTARAPRAALRLGVGGSTPAIFVQRLDQPESLSKYLAHEARRLKRQSVRVFGRFLWP